MSRRSLGPRSTGSRACFSPIRAAVAARSSRTIGAGLRRARLTIAHELGHFLLERHVLDGPTGFLCQPGDLREQRALTRHQRQEREANAFAIELLAPMAAMAPVLAQDPCLRAVAGLAEALEISLEACLWRIVERHDAALAMLVSTGGVVRYAIRGQSFPWLAGRPGTPLTPGTPAARAIARGDAGLTRMVEAHATSWLERAEGEIWEQTCVRRGGRGVTLLWAAREADDGRKGDDDGAEGEGRSGDDDVRELGMPAFRGRTGRR